MSKLAGKIIICPTPLGNLRDMTGRAAEALASADVVYAEDTRVTGRLAAALGIDTCLERLDENILAGKAHHVIDRVRTGETVAYCSDAGMPGVSDPGMRLIRMAREAGVTVEVLPGPSAAVTAYVASGAENPHYYFGGFFPRKDAERSKLLDSLRSLDAALIFYESPNRIASALVTIARVYPTRTIAVCRELTKLHEEVLVMSSVEMAEEFFRRSESGAIKGEIVIVIDGPTEEEQKQQATDVLVMATKRANELKASGSFTHKDIVFALQEEFGIARNTAYGLVHK